MCKANNNYSILQFQKDYPDDSACLDKLFQLRYNKLSNCPDCNEAVTFRRVATRMCYQCPKCYHQIYPCKNTIFENTKLPLIYWFYSIYLFTVSKNGISAYEVQRQLGVTYKTAWRMLKQIRTLCGEDKTLFSHGTVELDETFVGGKNKNRHADKKVQRSQGRSFKDKTPVFGVFHRETKKVRAFVVENTQSKSIQPLIFEHIAREIRVLTDEWLAYKGLSKHYLHEFVDHSKKEYANGDVTTNRIENFWSVFKRTLNGSYIHVSRKYLQLYADECSFRVNNRNATTSVFYSLLNLLSKE